jgi:hypothetical protein
VTINRHAGAIVPSEPSDYFDEVGVMLALQTAGMRISVFLLAVQTVEWAAFSGSISATGLLPVR